MTKRLIVAALPANQLAYTNAVFVAPDHARRFMHRTFADSAFVEVNGGLVYEVRTHDAIDVDNIGLSALHRQSTQVSQGDAVEVRSFDLSGGSNFNMAFIEFEATLLAKQRQTMEEDDLAQHILDKMWHMVFCIGQILVLDVNGVAIKIKVIDLEIANVGDSQKDTSSVPHGVILKGTTAVSVTTAKKEQLLTLRKSRNQARSNILRPSFKFSDMGIGGLDEEFGQIFRRAFASRTFPPAVIEKLGIAHVRGMMLHGPPGTGKTLIARQIGRMLHGREPKVVNGPEILNKFVGASEENIRKLFEDAEQDYQQNGEHADLHIIIFDEIDAICKARGSSGGSTGVHDTVVNQLLSKIDGVNSLNNILVIGMTNRKDMIDEALLRPGRLEVHVEIGLPDEKGRFDIFTIHTKSMRENQCLGSDVDLALLAAKSKNFSGAEIAGLIKSATSFALYGNVDVTSADTVAVRSVQDVMVCMSHFNDALLEVVPAFGCAAAELSVCLRGGMIDFGDSFRRTLQAGQTFVDQVKNSDRTPLLSVLLKGGVGCGKTALAAKLAIESDIPFIKLISPEEYVGFSDSGKVAAIFKVFRDAYKSPVSLIILDNIERLLEFTHIGPRFSNSILQALLVLIKKLPPNENRRLLVIGTTSNFDILEGMQFDQVFDVVLEVPAVHNEQEALRVFTYMRVSVEPSDLKQITDSIQYPIGIKQLLLVIEMAIQSSNSSSLTVNRFKQCLSDCNLDVSHSF